jgi:hypothetical protein
MRKGRLFRPTVGEALEDRSVPSAMGVGPGPAPFFGGGSSILGQDAFAVSKEFQTFQASFQSAVAALRLTATTTTGPTSAGLTAYDTAVATAITTLEGSISKDLSNLTNTGAALNTTIDGFLSTLQTNLDSAGTGLANSTNSAVRSLFREANVYLRTAMGQSVQAILTDTSPTSVSSSTLQTVHSSVHTAFVTFNNALGTAVQNVVKGTSTTLDTSATTQLQSDLTAAISSLPSGAQTTAIATDVANLSTALGKITLPTNTSNRWQVWNFEWQVFRTVMTAELQISHDIFSAIQTYNNSQL